MTTCDCGGCDDCLRAQGVGDSDELDAIAEGIWKQEIGDPIPGDRIRDALSEVLATADDKECEALGAALADGPEAFGDHLMGKVFAYLQAEVMEKAEKELKRQQKQAEEDSAADRLADRCAA